MVAATIFFAKVSIAHVGTLHANDGKCLFLLGNSTRHDLTPVTAVSVHLLSSNGTPVLVDGPIYVTVPLATQSSLSHNAYVAAWRFDQKLGKQEFCASDRLPDGFVTVWFSF